VTAGWQDRARCAEVDPDLWFPEKGGPGATLARRICARCEVRAECLAFALAYPGPLDGVWGGKTERERRALRHELRTAA
jgi:WhiB family redox-sensing transcriptional regulator